MGVLSARCTIYPGEFTRQIIYAPPYILLVGATGRLRFLLRIKLKRGYDITVKPDCRVYRGNEIVILGNYSKSKYKGTSIVSKYGVTPTVRENHGEVTGVLIN